MRSDSRYRFACAALESLADLEALLREQTPRVLILDEALLSQGDDETLRYLHRRMPGVDWMLAWDAPSARSFELAVRSRARGGVEWQASAEQIGRALRTILQGDLWFPRRQMQSLYFSLLSASQIEVALAPADRQPKTPIGVREELTARELETVVLMREGLTNKQISERLGVSVSTVKKHLEHTFRKRGLHNRRQALG